MVDSQKQLDKYLEADRLALGRNKISVSSKAFWAAQIIPDYIWAFERRLRTFEYFYNTTNSKSSIIRRFFLKIHYFRYKRLAIKLGFTIPPNVFGPGLSIAHYGTIVINKYARIGANCRIHAGVNIGTEAGYEDKAPKIGSNVYIGPGAKVFGDIVIGNNIAIGANAVVNNSFTEENVAIGGMPAKVLGPIQIEKILIKGFDDSGESIVQ